ncbi:MAG: hypothetical protein LBF27_29350 [Sphingobacterium sp.]|nr:hypothetical protein [Sphingobacterium sp.]
MKKSNLVVFICALFLFQSCQSQSLDFEKLVLPVKQTELKQLGLVSSGAGVGTQEVQYTNYSSDAVDAGKIAISFGGIKIETDNNSDDYTSGPLRMYGKNNGDSFEGYQLNISKPANFSEVLSYFLNKKDKFKLAFDNGKDTGERARVFISDQNKTTYLVLSRSNGNGEKKGYIDAISSEETPLLTSRLGGAFGYYAEYLEYRKHKSANFTYQDFLKELDNEIYNENNNLK